MPVEIIVRPLFSSEKKTINPKAGSTISYWKFGQIKIGSEDEVQAKLGPFEGHFKYNEINRAFFWDIKISRLRPHRVEYRWVHSTQINPDSPD